MIPMEECFIYQFGQWFLQHDVTICYPLCHCYPVCLMTGIQYVSNTWLILAPLKFLSLPQLPQLLAPCGTMWHHVAPHAATVRRQRPSSSASRGSRGSRGRHVSRWLIHIDPSQLSSGQHDVPHRLQGRADPGVLQKSPAAVVFSHQLSSPQQEV